MDQFELGARRRRSGIAQAELRAMREGGHQRRPVIGGRARDDTVIIPGITLRDHQRVASAVRTSLEIGAACRAAIMARDDRLCRDRPGMHRAMAIVDDPLGLVQRPFRIVGRIVPGIGRYRGIALRHRPDGDEPLARETAVEARAADAEQLSVPVGGEPDAQLDVRAWNRRGPRRDAADVVRSLDERGNRRSALGDDVGLLDRRPAQRLPGKCGALRRACVAGDDRIGGAIVSPVRRYRRE